MGHTAGYLHSKYPDFFEPDGKPKPMPIVQRTPATTLYIIHELRGHLRTYLDRLPESCRTEERLVIEDFLDWLEEKKC